MTVEELISVLSERLDALQKELREGLALMELRDQAREARATIVTVTTTLEENLIEVGAAIGALEVKIEALEVKIDDLIANVTQIISRWERP